MKCLQSGMKREAVQEEQSREFFSPGTPGTPGLTITHKRIRRQVALSKLNVNEPNPGSSIFSLLRRVLLKCICCQ